MLLATDITSSLSPPPPPLLLCRAARRSALPRSRCARWASFSAALDSQSDATTWSFVRLLLSVVLGFAGTGAAASAAGAATGCCSCSDAFGGGLWAPIDTSKQEYSTRRRHGANTESDDAHAG